MSRKILLNIIGEENNTGYNAASKARTDVDRTLVRNGYEIIEIPYAKYQGKLSAIASHLIAILKTIKKIERIKPIDIIIQYPGYRIGTRTIDLLTKLLSQYHLTILIHDIDSLRYKGEISDRELNIFKRSARILVHTENMYQYLVRKGVKVQMDILWLFDYYAKETATLNNVKDTYSLVFAGNLDKSGFLKKIGSKLTPYTLYLYGLPLDYSWPEGLKYEGKFAPDEINDIKGDWGLVWDGNSIEKCDGQMGEYLKYNSSHKVSLYLASGKPVIVWNQSAVAPFIKRNNLGLGINSLEEIPVLLNNISKEQYNKFLTSVKEIQEKLRSGKILETLVQNC